MNRTIKKLLASSSLVLCATPALADPVDWADWTGGVCNVATSQNLEGDTASGTIGAVSVSYTGNCYDVLTGTGTNYWTEPNSSYLPYTGSSTVDNAPTASEMVRLTWASNNTLVFSETLQDPVMAILSMGSGSTPVTYDFDTEFTVLSEGWGYWGDGSYTLGEGDHTLTGNELHAVIQFSGAVDSISWTSNYESWHGFTIGSLGIADVGGTNGIHVPEPASLALFGLGLAALGFGRRKA